MPRDDCRPPSGGSGHSLPTGQPFPAETARPLRGDGLALGEWADFGACGGEDGTMPGLQIRSPLYRTGQAGSLSWSCLGLVEAPPAPPHTTSRSSILLCPCPRPRPRPRAGFPCPKSPAISTWLHRLSVLRASRDGFGGGSRCGSSREMPVETIYWTERQVRNLGDAPPSPRPSLPGPRRLRLIVTAPMDEAQASPEPSCAVEHPPRGIGAGGMVPCHAMPCHDERLVGDIRMEWTCRTSEQYEVGGIGTMTMCPLVLFPHAWYLNSPAS
jgi:hypothetical protein